MPSNYPDGMREGDIPGYWDVECPRCDGEDEECGRCDGTGMVDSRDDYEVDYDPYDVDYEPYDARDYT